MEVTTSNGKMFEVDWMWGPVGINEDLMLQMKDDRELSDIALDFQGVEHFHRESENEGNMDWYGYTVLKSIVRPNYERHPELVQITLCKPLGV